MKLGTLLSRGALVAASLAMFAGTARADGLGSTLYDNGDMWVAYVGSDAAYTDDLFFFVTVGSFGDAQFLLTNDGSVAPGTAVDVNDTPAPDGEAIFGICVYKSGDPTVNPSDACGSADSVFYSGDGTSGRNTDGLDHGFVWTRADYEAATGVNLADLGIDDSYTYVLGFEDHFGGGDKDYNDVIFALKGVTTVPEPVTMTLLATGLVGMGGTGLVRRRKKKE